MPHALAPHLSDRLLLAFRAGATCEIVGLIVHQSRVVGVASLDAGLVMDCVCIACVHCELLPWHDKRQIISVTSATTRPAAAAELGRLFAEREG